MTTKCRNPGQDPGPEKRTLWESSEIRSVDKPR